MKPLIRLLYLVSPAQGLVDFQSGVAFSTQDPSGGNRLVYGVGSPLDPVSGYGLSGTDYVAELYVGADSASFTPLTASTSRFRSAPTANAGNGPAPAFMVLMILSRYRALSQAKLSLFKS